MVPGRIIWFRNHLVCTFTVIATKFVCENWLTSRSWIDTYTFSRFFLCVSYSAIFSLHKIDFSFSGSEKEFISQKTVPLNIFNAYSIHKNFTYMHIHTYIHILLQPDGRKVKLYCLHNCKTSHRIRLKHNRHSSDRSNFTPTEMARPHVWKQIIDGISKFIFLKDAFY